ncbi:pyridoxamine 5'-phosphate oxidase family protein [Halorubrum sp. CBA1125]|uniref:pyridoxamine 5'-phosphate oxidase family protein n=1 Tax=Halorubrum sp. CBA1125 TaxID=2668072 RepID=UPI0012E720A9|nr:pyridoxamine 5'-phosphate oxidase family protein [Halorubrum sp. CBA1125]MUW14210.1 pyridoxamine 5'-phosphate oxidase family protein [Halorubrum sp. CBA1125]
MSDTESATMDPDERNAFLGTGGTGVIAFSSSDSESPHSVPVSYGYDRSETTFYFRLSVGPDSDKGDVAGRHVTFVVYRQQDENWQSVIAKGQLEETTEASVATDSLEGLRQVHIPLVDIFGRPVKDVPFEFYRLVPDEMTSRKESSTAV